jgi:adenosylhomocysteine nucleosidase
VSRIAIVSALDAELRALLALVDEGQVERIAGRDFHAGTLDGRPVVLALSGVGKVAAAATAALLLDRYEVDAVLFTGVAGGLHAGVQVGDVVVASELLQHDLDASPLFPRFEVPLTGVSRFTTDARWADRLARAAAALPDAPPVHRGLVVSGDRFIATAAENHALRTLLPDALAVEMEGAAVAQVCADFARPCAVLRVISDRADDDAHVDFLRFVDEVAAMRARDIVRAALAA